MKMIRYTGTAMTLMSIAVGIYLAVTALIRARAIVRKRVVWAALACQIVLVIPFLLLGLDGCWSLLSTLSRIARHVLRAALCAMAVCFTLITLRVALAGRARGEAAEAGAILILGSALHKGRISYDLERRLDTGARRAEAHPKASVIVSGGNASDGQPSEAAVMRDALIKEGVSPARIVMDERAENTWDNMMNAARLADRHKPVIIVTSGYHMLRATVLAKRAGLQTIVPCPVPSQKRTYLYDLLWETVMMIRCFLLRS